MLQWGFWMFQTFEDFCTPFCAFSSFACFTGPNPRMDNGRSASSTSKSMFSSSTFGCQIFEITFKLLDQTAFHAAFCCITKRIKRRTTQLLLVGIKWKMCATSTDQIRVSSGGHSHPSRPALEGPNGT